MLTLQEAALSNYYYHMFSISCACRCVHPHQEIDLINVAFEQKGKIGVDPFHVPDRSTALSMLQELNPQRKWNLVLVSLQLSNHSLVWCGRLCRILDSGQCRSGGTGGHEVRCLPVCVLFLPDSNAIGLFREKRISRLVYPLSTVLDDSIGCAMWFAARGEGFFTRTRAILHSCTTAMQGSV